MNYACAAGIGAVSGLRSMTGPAAVLQTAELPAASTSLLLAAGELIADKLPFMPERTAPPSLLFRALSGAFCGYFLCGRGKNREAAITAAAIGAAAAVGASFVGLQFRKRTGLPGLAAALLEDATAIGLASAVVRSVGH